MKKIGIIGGLGPQSTELFYHEFIRLCQTRKKVEYPSILINSVNLWQFVRLLNDKKSLINFVKNEIAKIQDYVDFIAIPCNTIHFIIDEIREFSKVPVIAIHEEVVKEISKSKIKKVGILGTKTTVYNNFYQKELRKNNIDFEILSKDEEEKLNSLIFDKMLHGKDYEKMHKLLVKDIKILKNKGCEGIILACTELPLFIKQEEVDVKLFESTNILCKSVFEKVFNN
ncbi:MAG: amino acid racemase [Candidatus Pacearchaeota archaeon]